MVSRIAAMNQSLCSSVSQRIGPGSRALRKGVPGRIRVAHPPIVRCKPSQHTESDQCRLTRPQSTVGDWHVVVLPTEILRWHVGVLAKGDLQSWTSVLG
jgi:hypothetical protein